MTNQQPTTHERYLHAVRDVVIARATQRDAITAEHGNRLAHTKLLYGVGDGTYRGVTVFDAWQNGVGRVDIVEIADTGQESWIQLAGTVIHELGHVLAGMDAGHSNRWKDTAVALGFTVRPAAAGQVYRLAMIDSQIRHAVHDLAARAPHLRHPWLQPREATGLAAAAVYARRGFSGWTACCLDVLTPACGMSAAPTEKHKAFSSAPTSARTPRLLCLLHLRAVDGDRPDDQDVQCDHDGRPDRVRGQERDVHDRAGHGGQDADDSGPHPACEKRDAGQRHHDAADQMYPAQVV